MLSYVKIIKIIKKKRIKFADTPRDKDAKKMQQQQQLGGCSLLQQFLGPANRDG